MQMYTVTQISARKINPNRRPEWKIANGMAKKPDPMKILRIVIKLWEKFERS